jgi:hypothetical protein
VDGLAAVLGAHAMASSGNAQASSAVLQSWLEERLSFWQSKIRPISSWLGLVWADGLYWLFQAFSLLGTSLNLFTATADRVVMLEGRQPKLLTTKWRVVFDVYIHPST